MIRSIILLIGMISLSSFISYSNDEKNHEPISEKEIAKAICNCGWEVIRIDEDIKRYYENDDKVGLLNIKSRIRLAYHKFDTCLLDLKKRYKKELSSVKSKAIYDALKEECPTLVAIMQAHQEEN